MRSRNSRGRRQARIDVPALRPFDADRSQDAARIGAGIDADTVRPLIDRGPDCMAVNDRKSVVGVVAEERFADPAQVGLPLLIEANARPDSRVNEDIIAKAHGVVEAAKEFYVLARDRALNQRQRLVGGRSL